MDLAEYKGIYVIAEQFEGKLRDVSFELLGQARILADTIGDGTQIALARGQLRGRGDQAQGILVFRARPNGAGLGHAQLQAHQTRAAVTAAEPQVVLQRRFTPYRPNHASTPRLANSHNAN